MKQTEQPGTISVSALQGRPSRSADAARLAQIERDLSLGVRERMLRALDLGRPDGDRLLPGPASPGTAARRGARKAP